MFITSKYSSHNDQLERAVNKEHMNKWLDKNCMHVFCTEMSKHLTIKTEVGVIETHRSVSALVVDREKYTEFKTELFKAFSGVFLSEYDCDRINQVFDKLEGNAKGKAELV